MKVIITYGTDDYTDLLHEDMDVFDNEGKIIAQESVYPFNECPEDAIIGRGLVSCSRIYNFMKLAYEAGKNGEPLEYIYTEEEVDDD